MSSRNFTRVPFTSQVVIQSRFGVIEGKVENLCLSGIWMTTPQKVDVGTSVEIKVFALENSEDSFVILRGVVKRHEAHGMAIQFTGMSLDTYLVLRKIISCALCDDAKVFEEFFAYMINRKTQEGIPSGACSQICSVESVNLHFQNGKGNG